ncbi:MAG: manganese-dependent inorganic pyrophosphatase [Candidatus Heimdallarchaeota archaeon LC_2]|nr:MAG: manganese-dependent inorganic pyrophosphatase [Candidatus Heimdallarchaeota archaeon LC_2]
MFSEFVKYIKSFESDSLIYILLHHNADPDALCAGEALKELILQNNKEIIVKLFGDGINFSAKRILSGLNIKVINNYPEDTPNCIITVDTANLSQLGKYQNLLKLTNVTKIIIDHHDENELLKIADITVHSQDLGSTCLLIAQLYEEMHLIPSSKVSTMLICGHLYDSRRFIYGATVETFRLMSNLIRHNGNYDQANEYLQNEMSLGEKIARLKSSRRLNYKLVDKTIIVTSKVSAFESSSARSLIGLGGDVVFVIAKKPNEIRGSARTKLHDILNMGEILSQLAEEFNAELNQHEEKFQCSGGGHKNAAGLNIRPEISNNQQKRLMERFIEISESIINSKTQSSEKN